MKTKPLKVDPEETGPTLLHWRPHPSLIPQHLHWPPGHASPLMPFPWANLLREVPVDPAGSRLSEVDGSYPSSLGWGTLLPSSHRAPLPLHAHD